MQPWRGWSPRWLSGQYIFRYIFSSFPLRAKRTQSYLISQLGIPCSQKKKSSSEGVDRHVEDLPDDIYSNTFFLHFPWERNIHNLLQFLCKAFLALKKKKKRCSEGVDRHVEDLPDDIYSNTFFLHFPWERNVRNLLQFPCEAFLLYRLETWSALRQYFRLQDFSTFRSSLSSRLFDWPRSRLSGSTWNVKCTQTVFSRSRLFDLL